ncbi:hypothetical protein AND_003407 [Anopheles darlingi]|uniref:Cuticular protein 14 from Low Complexity family n=1 Tax=Anopheles darlingi TaxID=43151 RepID=W5JPZ6_ANODA|nr:hypothetical protein AND_003407 [Anopheles darlingi]
MAAKETTGQASDTAAILHVSKQNVKHRNKEYVEVPKPYAVHVEKPYPVYVKQPVYIEKQVPVTVHIKEHHKKPTYTATTTSLQADMKAFIVISMALALASAASVGESKKEKRGLWDLGSHQESYESYGYDSHQSHGYYGNDYSEKEVKQIITKKVPVPYPVEVEKHVPVEVKVPYPVEVEKKVPVVVEKKVPVYIEKKVPVHVDRPYPVEVKVPVEVPVYQKEYVEVPKPYAVHVDKPYPVYVKQPVYVEKPVPVTVLIKKEHKKPGYPSSSARLRSRSFAQHQRQCVERYQTSDERCPAGAKGEPSRPSYSPSSGRSASTPRFALADPPDIESRDRLPAFDSPLECCARCIVGAGGMRSVAAAAETTIPSKQVTRLHGNLGNVQWNALKFILLHSETPGAVTDRRQDVIGWAVPWDGIGVFDVPKEDTNQLAGEPLKVSFPSHDLLSTVEGSSHYIKVKVELKRGLCHLFGPPYFGTERKLGV